MLDFHEKPGVSAQEALSAGNPGLQQLIV